VSAGRAGRRRRAALTRLRAEVAEAVSRTPRRSSQRARRRPRPGETFLRSAGESLRTPKEPPADRLTDLRQALGPGPTYAIETGRRRPLATRRGGHSVPPGASRETCSERACDPADDLSRNPPRRSPSHRDHLARPPKDASHRVLREISRDVCTSSASPCGEVSQTASTTSAEALHAGARSCIETTRCTLAATSASVPRCSKDASRHSPPGTSRRPQPTPPARSGETASTTSINALERALHTPRNKLPQPPLPRPQMDPEITRRTGVATPPRRGP
jgi:hypothetical protein